MRDSVLIFGGGELQLSIIEKAKSLGFFTVVVDPDNDAKAKNICDAFYTVSGDDFETTLEVAIKHNVKGVVTAATDHPIFMMSRIAKELGLKFPTYESCFTVLDKGQFKNFLEVNNFPHAKGGVYTGGIEKINPNNFTYPVIIKPLRNSGSRGVIKCNEPEELEESVNECLTFCKDKKFIIEEFIEGDEISVEAFVYNKEVTIVQITDKKVTAPPYNVELGHTQPSKYSNKVDEITTMLQRVVDLSGLDDCMLHPELKLDGDSVTIIEIGPRLGGDYISSKLVPLSTGISLEEILIKIATGSDFTVDRFQMASTICYLNFSPNSIVKETLTEIELKKAFPEVIEFKHSLQVGESIKKITNSLNRYGHFILQAKDVESLAIKEMEITQFITNKLL